MQSVILNAKTSFSINRIMEKSVQKLRRPKFFLLLSELIINARENTREACINYSSHVNNREIDQEKQNKTVARR